MPILARTLKRPLTIEELEGLKDIYKHIMLDANLLVQSAVAKRIPVVTVYKGLIADIEQIDERIANLTAALKSSQPAPIGGEKT